MDVKYINPFLEAVINILKQFGIEDVKRGSIRKKESFCVNKDITSVIGLIGDIRGNLSYSLSQETGKLIVSSMMMGMNIEQLDEIGRSAIGELANMITGTAATNLSANGIKVDITPPSVIFGKDIYMIISSVQTICIDIQTSIGTIELGIGLEV